MRPRWLAGDLSASCFKKDNYYGQLVMYRFTLSQGCFSIGIGHHAMPPLMLHTKMHARLLESDS